MMIQGVSVGDMLNQSMVVLTKPSVESFEQYERRGGQREALIYVGVAAALAGIVGAVFGLVFGGVGGAIPIIGCLFLPVSFVLGLYQIYLGYLAARSSMNLDQNKAIITVVLSIIAMWIAAAILTFILAAIGLSAAAASGALNR